MIQSTHKSQKKIEALSDSEARFRAVFENAAVGIACVAPDGRFLEVNQRLCDIVGYAYEELMAKTFADITHPDDLKQDLRGMRRMLAGEIDTYLREKRYYRKDGSVVWVTLAVSQMRKADGSPGYFISIIEDISARRQVEENLRESEEKYRTLFESINQGFCTIEVLFDKDERPVDYRFVIVNPAFERQTGIENAVGRRVREIVPLLEEHWFEIYGRIALTGEPLRFEKPAEQLHRFYDVYAWRVGEPAERKVAILFNDITERKRAEEALRASEEKFRILADTTPVLIWASGTDKLCTFFNKSWLDFTGGAMEEELGYGWTKRIHPEDYDRSLEIYATYFDARESFKMEYRLRRHDGEYCWILDHGVPRFSPSGDFLGYIGSCIDITERKQAEAEREQLAQEQAAREAAEAANRSKDEFLAMVSHELRSPLNAILGYTRMLRSGPVDSDAIDNVTAIVERSAKAQIQIIEDLFDSARIITGKLRIEPGPVDLVPALEAALETVRAAAEAKGITLVADFGPEPEQVLGDSTRLQQVVWNLLTNAVKFTPEGGRVELRMEGADDNVRITVSDTGKGIEPGFLPLVFDTLRQADSSSARRYGGLGLGLSLVKHLVELHGGTITAASEGAGRGATFIVTLPRRRLEFIEPLTPAVTPREVRTEGVITMDHDLSLEGVSVLVVDDQEEARELLIQALSGYGAQVTAASSGVEALAFLSNPPDGKRPDALILDIAMPDEDGYTVLKKVRALEAAQGVASDRIPAIALTAYGRSEDRLRALQAGFHMHVAKPVDPAELAVVITSTMTMRAWERKRKD